LSETKFKKRSKRGTGTKKRERLASKQSAGSLTGVVTPAWGKQRKKTGRVVSHRGKPLGQRTKKTGRKTEALGRGEKLTKLEEQKGD